MATMSEVQTMIPTWTTGERLGKARDSVDMKQDEMADALGVGRRSIIRYESSDSPPRKIVLAYASVTGIPVWWIEGYETEEAAVRSRCFLEMTLPFDWPTVWTVRQGTPHNFLTIPELAGHPPIDNDAIDAGAGGQWMTNRRVGGYTDSGDATSRPAPSTNAPVLLAA